MRTTYSHAVIPDRWRIAGLRLNTLTLGHVALGERMGVPYFLPPPLDRQPGPGDLALALYIAGNPWRVSADKLRRNQGRWARRCLVWIAGEPASFAELQNRFLTYLEAQLSGPETWSKSQNKEVGCPAMLALRARLVADFGVGWAESLDIPVGEALWMSAAQAEREGSVDWVNDQQRQAMELAKQLTGKPQTQEPPASAQQVDINLNISVNGMDREGDTDDRSGTAGGLLDPQLN